MVEGEGGSNDRDSNNKKPINNENNMYIYIYIYIVCLSPQVAFNHPHAACDFEAASSCLYAERTASEQLRATVVLYVSCVIVCIYLFYMPFAR